MANKARASLAGVTVSFGVVNFVVDLVPATRAKADKRSAESVALLRACPTCTEGVAVKQTLVCEKGHGPLPQSTLAQAVMVDGELRKLNPAEAEKLKTPEVEAKTVSFSVFPADQVEAVTMPSGNVYRMRLPRKAPEATVKAYGLMLELVGDAGVAFLAELVVKGVSKLYRGVSRDGMVTLTELVRPSMFYEPDGADVTVDERMVAAGRAMVAEMVTDFDPDGWESAAATRVEALVEAARAGKVGEVAEPEFQAATAAAEDLLDLLQRSAA